MTSDHPLQKVLWDLEWAIHYAVERAERADDEANKAWSRVSELERQLNETLDACGREVNVG